MLSRASELQHINIQIVNTFTTRYTFTIIPTANSVQTHDHKFLFTRFRPRGGALVHLVNHLRRPKTSGMVLSKTVWLRMPYSVDQMRASLQMVEGFVKNPSVNFVQKKNIKTGETSTTCTRYVHPKTVQGRSTVKAPLAPSDFSQNTGPRSPSQGLQTCAPNSTALPRC